MMRDVMTDYLMLLGCVAATFALIAFCIGASIVARQLFWIGRNAAMATRAEYRTRLGYARNAAEQRERDRLAAEEGA